MSQESDCLYCGGHKAYHKADATHCRGCWTCDDCQMHGCDVNYDELHHSNVKSSKGSKKKKLSPTEQWVAHQKQAGRIASTAGVMEVPKYSTIIGGHEAQVGRVSTPRNFWLEGDQESESDQDSARHKQTKVSHIEQEKASYKSWKDKLQEKQDDNFSQLLDAVATKEKKDAQPQDNPDRKVHTVRTSASPVPHFDAVTDEGYALSLYRILPPKNYKIIPTTISGTIIINGKEHHKFYVRGAGLEIVITLSFVDAPQPVVGVVHLMDDFEVALAIGWNGEKPPEHELAIKYDVVEVAPSGFPTDDGITLSQRASGDANLYVNEPVQKKYTWGIVFHGPNHGPEADVIYIHTANKSIGEAMTEAIRILGDKKVSQAVNIYLKETFN